MTRITIDFETRSLCDIRTKGSWIYSKDPSTEVLCLAYAIDDKPVKLWIPPKQAIKFIFNVRACHKGLRAHFIKAAGKPRVRFTKAHAQDQRKAKLLWLMFKKLTVRNIRGGYVKGWSWDGPAALPVFARYPIHGLPKFFEHLGPGTVVEAHNAFFEKSIWRNVCIEKYGFPDIPECRWECSAALAGTRALPRALGKLGEALGLEEQKSDEGNLVMLQLAKPNQKGEFYNDPQRFNTLFNYCLDDVRAERAIAKRLGSLSPKERDIWLLDQKINWRGIPVDLDIVKGAIKITKEYTKVLEEKMKEVTKGKLSNIRQTEVLKLWLEENGVLVDNVQKATIEAVLARENLPKQVRKVLEIRQALGQTSVRKYNKILDMVDKDGRVRDQFMYSGASTLRWSARGIQPQNLPRGNMKPEELTEDVFRAVASGSWRQVQTFGDTIDVLSSCIRGAIAAPQGSRLLDSDFSNIEGRVLAWVAGEQWKVKAFADFDIGKGHDLYNIMYTNMFGGDPGEVDSYQRLLGKVAELACGYMGGVGAFQNMAGIYGLEISDKEANEIKTVWRKKNPNIVKFWHSCEEAALKCTLTKKKQVVNGYISFEYVDGFLVCNLPSGGKLYYYDPKPQEVETPWGQKKLQVTFMGTNSVSRKWERQSTYGGKLVENIVQSIARDLLCEAMLRLDKNGFDINMHVHDQVICQIDSGDADPNEYGRLMSIVPAWCPDLPIAAGGDLMKRFRKD